MTKNRTDLDILDTISACARDLMVRRNARVMRHRLAATPMTEILAHVPGPTVAAKCQALGIARATWYSWMVGRARPRGATAHRLAQLTGIGVAEIRGLSGNA
jgi:hypothetical protein